MKKTVLYEGKYIRLVCQDTWEYVERLNTSGVVVIIAVTEDQKVILCEQYRVPVGRSVLELPAGLVNDTAQAADETFEEAARRELLEETGYEAKDMTFVFEGPIASGSSSVHVSFYRAGGLKKVGCGGGDASENITVHEVPLRNLDIWIREIRAAGQLIDPKVFSAFYFLEKNFFLS